MFFHCRERRELVIKQIHQEEEEVQSLKSEISTLTQRLGDLEDSLARKHATKCNYDKTILQTEAAYSKIIESSLTLLGVLKRETRDLE
jgi:Sjoegren syndrome nuclear autoantigen 1